MPHSDVNRMITLLGDWDSDTRERWMIHKNCAWKSLLEKVGGRVVSNTPERLKCEDVDCWLGLGLKINFREDGVKPSCFLKAGTFLSSCAYVGLLKKELQMMVTCLTPADMVSGHPGLAMTNVEDCVVYGAPSERNNGTVLADGDMFLYMRSETRFRRSLYKVRTSSEVRSLKKSTLIRLISCCS
jgi:hypothetical protein